MSALPVSPGGETREPSPRRRGCHGELKPAVEPWVGLFSSLDGCLPVCKMKKGLCAQFLPSAAVQGNVLWAVTLLGVRGRARGRCATEMKKTQPPASEAPQSMAVGWRGETDTSTDTSAGQEENSRCQGTGSRFLPPCPEIYVMLLL